MYGSSQQCHTEVPSLGGGDSMPVLPTSAEHEPDVLAWAVEQANKPQKDGK